ncbi:MAG TPA: hypothetical protein VIN67_03330 [Desulfobaccales bacterium]
MATFDQDDDLLMWLAAPLPNDLLTSSRLILMAEAKEQAAEVIDPEPSCAYVIRGWFVPFLFGPARRFMRGRC